MPYQRELAEAVHRLEGDLADPRYHMTLMGLAGVLAAVGLLTNSVPVLIGAMLVAPAFPPLALLSIALVIGRGPLATRTMLVALLGIAFGVALATVTTWLLNVLGIIPDYDNLFQRQLLEERVRPGWYSMVTALAAGVAGMLATIRNETEALIGSLAAVALVPAGGAAGIAFISADPARGIGGLVLLGMNLVLIVATGMLVLLAIGRGR